MNSCRKGLQPRLKQDARFHRLQFVKKVRASVEFRRFMRSRGGSELRTCDGPVGGFGRGAFCHATWRYRILGLPWRSGLSSAEQRSGNMKEKARKSQRVFKSRFTDALTIRLSESELAEKHRRMEARRQEYRFPESSQMEFQRPIRRLQGGPGCVLAVDLLTEPGQPRARKDRIEPIRPLWPYKQYEKRSST
jgi:hypothetical protein